MNRFSNKVKIIYLTLVILFSAGVFAYLLDTWGIITLDTSIPFLEEEPPRVPDSDDSITEIELERIRKEEQRLRDKELELSEIAAQLEEQQEELEREREELEALRSGIEEERDRLQEEQEERIERDRMVREMARRIGNMPPDDAVGIIAGWSNADVVEVFAHMEEEAEEEGQASIVPFLLTQMPRDRASIITTLMMDAEARRVPR